MILFVEYSVEFATPCTQYNERKTLGNNQCMECTMIRWSKSKVKHISEYVTALGRDGEYYPVKRFLPIDIRKPQVKPGKEGQFQPNDQERCLWCPYTQKCGHSLDFRVHCPLPGDAASSQRGFISRHDCTDTWDIRRERTDVDFEREARELESMTYPEETDYLTDKSKIAHRPVHTRVRETDHLSWGDTLYECYGRCVYPGDTTYCSAGITKSVSKEVSYHAQHSNVPGVNYGVNVLPMSKTPVPCKMKVPDRELKAARVHGVYSHLKGGWQSCDLISCEKLLALKEDNQHRVSPKEQAKELAHDLGPKFKPKQAPAKAKPGSARVW